jgi:hypothetical protein
MFLWLIFAGASAAAAQWLVPAGGSRPGDAEPARDGRPLDNPGDRRWSALPARPALGEPAGEPVAALSWAPAPVEPLAAAAARPSKLAPPPMAYRIAGKILQEGKPQIVLAKADVVVMAREGETLDDGYRVEAIRPDQVTLVYLPLGVRESLPVPSTFLMDELTGTAASGATSAPR